MGVRTTADEKIDDARQHIKEAAMALSAVVIEECWGHDDYNEDFRAILREVLNELINIRGELGD